MSDRVPVYDKQGRKIGVRGGDYAGAIEQPKKMGLAEAAAAAKAKREAAAKTEYESPVRIRPKKQQ